MKHIVELARAYWKLRDSGETGETRTVAHNALLDAMTKAGVAFIDREDAARIARAMIVVDDAGIVMVGALKTGV